MLALDLKQRGRKSEVAMSRLIEAADGYTLIHITSRKKENPREHSD
jgi:hypothetical protein